MTYPRAVGVPGVREHVLARFRALGGSPDRWQRRDREAMAEAITRAEDEVEGSRVVGLCDGLRALRRALECELWP